MHNISQWSPVSGKKHYCIIRHGNNIHTCIVSVKLFDIRFAAQVPCVLPTTITMDMDAAMNGGE